MFFRGNRSIAMVAFIVVLLAGILSTTHYINVTSHEHTFTNQLALAQAESIPHIIIDDQKIQDHYDEVIIKWRDGESLPIIPGTELLVADPKERIAKLAVSEGSTVQEVLFHAQKLTQLEYIQPNYRYKLQVHPNDPGYSEQWHHQKVNMHRAWDVRTGNTDVVIAVLDTGVDLEHPELKANLVQGHNILQPSQSAQDDYGHGTQVAGVLGAVGNNNQGGAGVLWNAKIMPIKVLDKDGEGDDYSIGQGIRYAVRNGAKIIVLSLGDRLYSKHMEDAVNFAEQEGVLLVAATGNNGSTVNYPAAFPTVLAVGASDRNDRVPSYSNFGPEVDVVAPGQNIYTTTLRGQMTFNSGTSMSTPIVAGIAALIMAQYPEMEPWQVRQLIRQSTVDINNAGWDSRSGYGRVDAHRALTVKPTIDIWAPNHTWEQAKIFPQGAIIVSALQGVNDKDWFYIDVAHRGKVQLPFQSQYRGIGLSWYQYKKEDDQPRGELVPFIYSSDRNLEPGRYYIEVRVTNWLTIVESLQQANVPQSRFETMDLRYQMLHRFLIAEDRHEMNQSIAQAAEIDIFHAERLEQGRPFVLIEGTLHRDNDFDWYSLDLPYSGEVLIEVVNSYGRMDPVLTISRTLSTDRRSYEVVDDHAQGAGEFWRGNVGSGKFYFMVADYQLRSHPVPYQVKITYFPTYVDRWEPNNRRQDAPTLIAGFDIHAFLNGNQDRDWFAFVVEEDMEVSINFQALVPNLVMNDVSIHLNVFESTRERATYSMSVDSRRDFTLKEFFTPGVYYLLLNREGVETQGNRQIPYKLHLNYVPRPQMDPILQISNPKQNQVFQTAKVTIEGQTDPGSRVTFNGAAIPVSQSGTFSTQYVFENTGTQLLRFVSTNQAGVRKEETVRVTFQPSVSFSDLYTAEQRKAVYSLADAGIIQGFPDGTFRPEQSLTRGEVVSLLLRAMGVNIDLEFASSQDRATAVDIESGHWAYPAMQVAVSRGLILGFPDQTLRPDESVTRAQLATILTRAFQDHYQQRIGQLPARQQNQEMKYKDVSNHDWAYPYIHMNTIVGYIDGYGNQTFSPEFPASRQQVVNALYKIIMQ